VRATVLARDESGGTEAGYGLETEAAQLDGPMLEAAAEALEALEDLRQPLLRLTVRLEAIVEEGRTGSMARPARGSRARAVRSWRTDLLAGWIALLGRLGGPADPDYVDWLALDRSDGREWDMGLHRHHLDPMKPFAEVVLAPAHGVLMTSATLTDGGDWSGAVARSGAARLDVQPQLFAAKARSTIPTRRSADRHRCAQGRHPALAGAYARLIEASGGGVLGLFTAIRRLRAVHGRIADRLARAGLPLYAQHVDPIDTGTLVDIFRDDPRASLLGTDALRDGVDVPGQSLRLVVMEQVPWPKPSILHRAAAWPRRRGRRRARPRRSHHPRAPGAGVRPPDPLGGRPRAFRGAFLGVPSRLLSAFPPGTPVRRVSLEQALQSIAARVDEGVLAGEVAPNCERPA
jgi:ATP-dependent DNA helicase DinG